MYSLDINYTQQEQVQESICLCSPVKFARRRLAGCSIGFAQPSLSLMHFFFIIFTTKGSAGVCGGAGAGSGRSHPPGSSQIGAGITQGNLGDAGCHCHWDGDTSPVPISAWPSRGCPCPSSGHGGVEVQGSQVNGVRGDESTLADRNLAIRTAPASESAGSVMFKHVQLGCGLHWCQNDVQNRNNYIPQLNCPPSSAHPPAH